MGDNDREGEYQQLSMGLLECSQMLRDLLSRLRSPGESFRHQVLHGGIWSAVLNVGNRALQLVKLVILARILSPEAFGLLGIALLTMGALKQFSKLGFREALIQHPDENVDAYLNTVWIAKIARGSVLAVALFAAAGPVSGFFGEPRAMPLLQVMSIAVLLEGLINPAVLYYQKELKFYKEFVYKISGTIGDFIVAVAVAIMLGTVWALVYGILAKWIIQVSVSHLLTEHRTRPEFNVEYARELFGFGRWIFASAFIYFLVTTGDDVFVGWYLGAATLGIYQMAFRFSNAPATEVSHVVGSVMFPAISMIQKETRRIRNLLFHSLFVISLIAAPMAAGIALIAPEFTRAVMGEKWLPMVPVLQILTLSGFLRALTAVSGPVFRGTGLPKWTAYESVVRLTVITITIWPLTDLFGASGTALSITLAIGATLVFAFYKLRYLIDITLYWCFQFLWLPLVATALMAVPVILLKGPTAMGIALPILVGVLVYIVTAIGLIRVSNFDTTVFEEISSDI